jgi:hypothetical protein
MTLRKLCPKGMLSEAEVQFLKGEKRVCANYARVLRYRIRAKARTPRAVSDDPETWQAAHSLDLITEKRNGITEICNGLRSDDSENEGIGRARRDSNPRLSAPEADALIRTWPRPALRLVSPELEQFPGASC